MANNRKKPLDARGWFNRGDHFQFTEMFLSNQPSEMQYIYIRPHIVMKAFASECYLKCLMMLEGAERPPQTHHLLILFDKLSPKSRQKITSWWNKLSKPVMDKAARENRSHPIPPKSKNLRHALNEAAEAFVDWRYASDGTRLAFSVMAFPMFVRTRIVELHPEWDYKQPHPLAWLNPEPGLIESKGDVAHIPAPSGTVLYYKSTAFTPPAFGWRGPYAKDDGSK